MRLKDRIPVALCIWLLVACCSVIFLLFGIRGKQKHNTTTKFADIGKQAYAIGLMCLGEWTDDIGKSIYYNEQAVEIYKSILTNHVKQWELCAPLAGLIDDYLYIGDTTKATPLIDEYVSLYTNYWYELEDYNTKLHCLINISNWYINLENYEQALPFLLQLQESISDDDYMYLGLLEKLKGHYYLGKSDYESAIEAFLDQDDYLTKHYQYLIDQETQHPSHRLTKKLLKEYYAPLTTIYADLSQSFWLNGDYETAYDIDTISWKSVIECYGHNSQNAIAHALQNSLHAWTLGNIGDCFVWEDYAFEAIKKEYDTEISQLPSIDREKYWRKQLPYLRRGITYTSNFPYLTYAASLGYNETLFTKGLLLRSVSSTNLSNHNVTWEDIQQSLDYNDIAVDFAIGDRDSIINYVAFIIRNDWEHPKCVVIDNEENLLNTHNATSIWQTIIDSANIQPNDNIYFAPDGVLCNVPTEYLPLPDGRPMNDVYNMYRLSSTREICFRDTIEIESYQTATLYGGLFYNADSTTLLTEAKKYKSTHRAIAPIDEQVWSQWRADDRANYQYLPYTKLEVNSINEVLEERDIKTTLYTEVSGNEESFKALSNNAPNILHIATHGYYITPLDVEVASKAAIQRMGINIDERQSIIDYSMERTGLLLAGATLKLQTNTQIQGVEDGILSAKEISTLDLSNVDLAVLSACKTGLGDITSDGVAGLQRGFKCAGVKSILMTLWEVDDAATHIFMNQFYNSLMTGSSKHEALYFAQKYLREYQDDGEYIYNDFHYWAAFVLLDGI